MSFVCLKEMTSAVSLAVSYQLLCNRSQVLHSTITCCLFQYQLYTKLKVIFILGW